jgi:hypothetical protein
VGAGASATSDIPGSSDRRFSFETHCRFAGFCSTM